MDFHVRMGITLAPSLPFHCSDTQWASLSLPEFPEAVTRDCVCDPLLPLQASATQYLCLPTLHPPHEAYHLGESLPALFCMNHHLWSLPLLSKRKGPRNLPTKSRAQPACAQSYLKTGVNHFLVHKLPETPPSANLEASSQSFTFLFARAILSYFIFNPHLRTCVRWFSESERETTMQETYTGRLP